MTGLRITSSHSASLSFVSPTGGPSQSISFAGASVNKVNYFQSEGLGLFCIAEWTKRICNADETFIENEVD